jgi:hypothetical protein
MTEQPDPTAPHVPWRWTRPRIKAAQMLADGETHTATAKAIGVARKTIIEWLAREEFAERVDRITATYADGLIGAGMRNREARVAQLEVQRDLIAQFVMERASDKDMAHIPGASTGLVRRTFKALGRGADFRVVEEYALDRDALAELRAHSEHIARELGQWTEKHEHSGPDGGPVVLVREFKGLDPDEV